MINKKALKETMVEMSQVLFVVLSLFLLFIISVTAHIFWDTKGNIIFWSTLLLLCFGAVAVFIYKAKTQQYEDE